LNKSLDLNINEDGILGHETVRALHQFLSSKVSVPLTKKLTPMLVRGLQNYLIQNLTDPGPVDGVFGVQTTGALQKLLKLRVDGDFGPQTNSALFRYLTLKGFPPTTKDGILNPTIIYSLSHYLRSKSVSIVSQGGNWDSGSVYASQIFLLNEGYNPGPIDGDWGVESVFAMQRYLNYWHAMDCNKKLYDKVSMWEGDIDTLKQKSLSDLNNMKYALEENLNRVNMVISEKEVETGLCVVCLEIKKEYVFVPCGHFCCCATCTQTISQCPMCRKNIEQKVKVYDSS